MERQRCWQVQCYGRVAAGVAGIGPLLLSLFGVLTPLLFLVSVILVVARVLYLRP